MTTRSDHPLFRLISYQTAYTRRVVKGACFSFLNKLFDIAPEILIGAAVDVVVRRDQSWLGAIGVVEPFFQIVVLAVLTFLIWVFESLFEYLYNIEWRNLAQAAQHDLRLDAYSHVQDLNISYFEDRSTGGLVSILNDDINQLERFLDGGANAIIQVVTSFVLIGAVFFYLAPQVAIIAMLPIPVILAGTFYFQRRAEPLYARVRDQAGRLSGRLANNLTGISTIKSYVTEPQEVANLRKESEAYLKANAGAIKLGSAFVPVIRMAVLAGFIGTLVLGGWQTLAGELEVGSFSVLVFLTQRLLWPLTGLAEVADLYQRAMASTRRVLDLLATPGGDHRGGLPVDKSSLRGRIEFAGVDFAYRGRSQVLKNVNLVIPAGSTAAFVGTTGSGKSTLAKLVMRFYEPDNGRILIDGRDISSLAVDDLRRCIAYVSQDVFLFDGTVADNIAYGSPGASSQRVREAGRLAEAEEFILALPQGYDTLVGERGQKLSGGQKQRISLARAILKDAPILILDEATSAVDNETEEAIQRSLETVSVGRTTIVIAHRLTTIRSADQVFTLEDGRVAGRSRFGSSESALGA
jgi:ATP-binding cassette subfamily B protein